MMKRDLHKPRRRHHFFLNPYKDAAFTKCPRCGGVTRLRKLPLVIHIEPNQLFVLNKTCRYCERCDLIITRKSEVESFMATGFEQRRPEIVGNKYVVFGVLERKDWLESKKGGLSEGEAVERVIAFKDVWDFELTPGGWHYDPNAARSKP